MYYGGISCENVAGKTTENEVIDLLRPSLEEKVKEKKLQRKIHHDQKARKVSFQEGDKLSVCQKLTLYQDTLANGCLDKLLRPVDQSHSWKVQRWQDYPATPGPATTSKG